MTRIERIGKWLVMVILQQQTNKPFCIHLSIGSVFVSKLSALVQSIETVYLCQTEVWFKYTSAVMTLVSISQIPLEVRYNLCFCSL